MNENAQKWVAVLRSGSYEQGQGCLRKADKYCCLGVATDLYQKATGEGKWVEIDRSGMMVFDIEGHRKRDYLLDEIAEWLGMTTVFGEFHDSLGKSSLSNENDKGVPFDEIANLAEQHQEVLFNAD